MLFKRIKYLKTYVVWKVILGGFLFKIFSSNSLWNYDLSRMIFISKLILRNLKKFKILK